MERLDDRTVVVTGAASGIGRATAIAFADAGCHTALADVDAEGLEETRKLIGSRFPGCRVETYEVDVSDAEAVEGLAESVVDDFGSVEIAVNNAGINITARFENHTLEGFHRVMDVNFWGVVHGCRSFLPYLRSVEEGHLVNISSMFGYVGMAGQSSYSASKFAVRGFSESLREELIGTDVEVSVVHPGCIDTAIVREAEIPDPKVAEKARSYFEKYGTAPEVVARRIVDAVRTGRHRVVVTPEARVSDWIRRLVPTMGNRLANRVMAKILGIEP